jgi:hypothetical protein
LALEPNIKGVGSLLLARVVLFSRLRVPMGNYSYGKGRRKAVEKVTTWQWLGMLAMFVAISIGMLLLYMLGYLHIDAD